MTLIPDPVLDPNELFNIFSYLFNIVSLLIFIVIGLKILFKFLKKQDLSA
jgi:hypothetical protein